MSDVIVMSDFIAARDRRERRRLIEMCACVLRLVRSGEPFNVTAAVRHLARESDR